MGTSVPAMRDLSSYFKTVGFVGLLLLGLGMLFGSLSYYIDFGYAVSSGSLPAAIWAFLVLGALVATVLLILSALTIQVGRQVRGGDFPRKIILTVLSLAAVAFILNGVGMFALYSTCNSNCSYYGYGSILDSGIISLIAGIVLIIASSLSRGLTLQARITGSIFALAFGVLSSLVYYAAYLSSLIGYGSFVSLFSNVSGIYNPLGILDWGGLTGIAFIIVAVGFLLYSIMMKTKAVAIGYIVVLVGALIFAIGLVSDSLSQVTASSFWSFVSSTPIQGILPAIAEIVFVFAGFLLLAGSALGMAVQGQGLAGMMKVTTAPAQPTTAVQMGAPVAEGGEFCPSCGTQNAPENAYCRKCGAKLG